MLFIPCGGLCNRIQNIVSAMVWSEESGIPIKFTWTVGDEVGNGRFEDYFYPDRRFTNVEKRYVDRDLSGSRRSVGIGGPIHFWGFTHVDGEGDDINGYPKGYQRLLRGIGRDLLKPTDHIQKAADEYCSANEIKDRIGIHVRDFEQVTDYSGNRSGNPDGIINNVLNAMNKNDRYFLCSDSAQIRHRISSDYPNTVYRKENDNGMMFSDRNTVAGTTSGFVDFLILSRCKSVIGTRGSSFSLLASLLHSIPLKWMDSPRYTLYKGEPWAQSSYWKEDRP